MSEQRTIHDEFGILVGYCDNIATVTGNHDGVRYVVNGAEWTLENTMLDVADQLEREAVECGKSPHALTRAKGLGYLQSAIRIRSAIEEGER